MVVEKRGADHAGKDVIERDVAASIFQVGSLGQAGHGMLSRVVRRRVLSHGQGQSRGRIDDHPAALLKHLLDGALHAQPDRLEIDRDHAVELVFLNIGGEIVAATDSGVIVDNIQTAEAADGGGQRIAHLRRRSDVDLEEYRLPSVYLDGLEALLPLFGIDISQRDPRTCTGKRLGATGTDTGTDDGDQHYLVLKLHAGSHRLSGGQKLSVPAAGSLSE